MKNKIVPHSDHALAQVINENPETLADPFHKLNKLIKNKNQPQCDAITSFDISNPFVSVN